MKKTILAVGFINVMICLQFLSAHDHPDRSYVDFVVPVSVTPVHVSPYQPFPSSTPLMNTQQTPPADLIEKSDPCPGNDYVWEKGHWQWNHQWVWVKGRWITKPHPSIVRVSGHWENRHGKWEWREPHWR